MAYFDVSVLSQDQDFRNRVTACYVTENPADNNPSQWASDHIWQISSAPGFGDKYAYALETGVVNPGRDPAVISDGDILSAVQSLTVGTELNPIDR